MSQNASLSLTLYGTTYSIDNIQNDVDGDELLDLFKRLMVCAGYAPAVMSDENGSWVYAPRKDE